MTERNRGAIDVSDQTLVSVSGKIQQEASDNECKDPLELVSGSAMGLTERESRQLIYTSHPPSRSNSLHVLRRFCHSGAKRAIEEETNRSTNRNTCQYLLLNKVYAIRTTSSVA